MPNIVLQDDLGTDEPIPNLAKYFPAKSDSAPPTPESARKKKAKNVGKRLKPGKIEKVISRFLKV